MVYGESLPAWERTFPTRREAATFARLHEGMGDRIFSIAKVVPGELPQSKPSPSNRRVAPMAHLICTYRDYWADDHRPYRNILVDSETGAEIGQFGDLEKVFQSAGVEDGDEVIITIERTGVRPFGSRRIRLTAPHTYTLDPA